MRLIATGSGLVRSLNSPQSLTDSEDEVSAHRLGGQPLSVAYKIFEDLRTHYATR